MFAVSTDEFADTVCDYIIFSVMCSIPQKTVKVYFNNKPWISKHIKGILNEQNNNRPLLNIIWKN